MAFTLQASTHALQFLHFSVIIMALPSSSIIASAGHIFTHAPQPTQSSVAILGKFEFFVSLFIAGCSFLFSEMPCLKSGILQLGHNSEAQGVPRLWETE